MKFKTNAKCVGCMNRILDAMKTRLPNEEWTMDLNNADKILECHGIPDDAAKASEVIKTLEETGFQGSWIRE